MSGQPSIVFNDGAAYEEFMGVWSRLAGEVFLDWLAPPAGLRWVDVGCGNGASTALLLDRCAPAIVEGVDPSPEQLAYAKDRLAGRAARFRQGQAAELPFADDSLDAGMSALVLHFMPDPTRGVAELARVVRPGGIVAAYTWDLPDGFPIAAIHEEAKAAGITVPRPPSESVTRLAAMQALWSGAGLAGVQARSIAVTRRFADFEAYWSVALRGPTIGGVFSRAAVQDVARVKDKVRARIRADADGAVTITATAHAVKGLVA